MAEASQEYDWAKVTGRTVERLRAKKVVPVPEAIIEMAQRSWDGVPDPKNPDKLLHNLSHRFPTPEIAAKFYRLVKKAGPHTTPRTSVSAVINPDPEGTFDDNGPTTDCDVSWKAGKPRGRQAQD